MTQCARGQSSFSALMSLKWKSVEKRSLAPFLSIGMGNEHEVSVVVVGVPARSTLNTMSAAVEQRCLEVDGIPQKKEKKKKEKSNRLMEGTR